MSKGFWAQDWFTGLVYTLLFILTAIFLYPGSFQALERDAYDFGVRLNDRPPNDRVAVVAIDDRSIDNLGRWPWSRDIHAQMIDKLTKGGAKVIGNTIFYSEEQADAGLSHINELLRQFQKSSLPKAVPQEAREIERISKALRESRSSGPTRQLIEELDTLVSGSALLNRLPGELSGIARTIFDARKELQTDQKLADAYGRAKNVVQAYTFNIGIPRGRPDEPLPEHIRSNRLEKVSDPDGAAAAGLTPIPTVSALSSIATIGSRAAAHGHLTSVLDLDGAQRFEPLVLQHFDEYYPSFALMIAARALNLGPGDIELRLGEGIRLGSLAIDTEPDLRMYAHFYGERDNGQPAFEVDSFFDVLFDAVPASKYKDRIVLLGATATGIGDRFATPVSGAEAPVVTLAHVVSSILGEDFYTRPGWAPIIETLLFLLLAAYLMFALPRLRAGVAAAISGGIFVVLVVTGIMLVATSALWLKLMIPATFLFLGHIVLTVKTLRVTERLKMSSDMESAESNKMLGLAFQGQGQLDMAFDKFRKCPLDENMMDPLYNLAQDFERKRQFSKAMNVYEHLLTFDAGFRDAKARRDRAQQLSETVSLGGKVGAGTLMFSGDGLEKPMLGRYEVEKELGKGAMGIVYLGRDPKIGRTVAIKTMALAQEFEDEELEEVKSRFFREAETAGRLSHPHIVTIFDAGEEHDLAYIAMEFIKGYDLMEHVKPEALMSVPLVVKTIADAADALGYAHQQNVVHRDIKPANLMWLTEKQIVKVTDFGIARLTDSSKTKTGMVLGTPSYMSPEQLSGRKVDGRSDLFSLGVTLYQLLTGRLPFQADSMATLMFKIANETQADPTSVRPDLDPRLNPIIARAMAKDIEQRYQSGAEMAAALRALLA